MQIEEPVRKDGTEFRRTGETVDPENMDQPEKTRYIETEIGLAEDRIWKKNTGKGGK